MILPSLAPALLTGFALAFARALGEYGSVVFIAGNMPFMTEIAPLLIITKLEQFDYAGATAIAVVMLVVSFVLLLVDQPAAVLEQRRHAADAWRTRALRADAAPTTEPAWVRLAADRPWRSAFLGALPGACRWWRCSPRPSRKGADAYLAAVSEPDALRGDQAHAAGRPPIAVPLNLVFGVAAAWAIAKFEFRGKQRADHADRPAVLGLAGGRRPDLRAAVRRAGLVRALAARARHQDHLRGARASCWRRSSSPFPFVARELIPLMEAQGTEEEEAARELGALGLADVLARHAAEHQVGPALRRDPLQRARDGRVRRGVSVVSGHIRGETNTMPLHVEILYNEYNLPRRLRRRLAAGAAGAGHAGAQDAGRVERQRAMRQRSGRDAVDAS